MQVTALAESSDADVVADVVRGARASFEILVRRHNQRLYRAARAITRSDADAEDVLQQTWLAIFKNLGRFRGESAFATWATRIAVNEAIAMMRKRPLLAEVPEIVDVETPERELDRAELGKLLEHCLGQLPQGNREVMVLRDVLELDTAETAACLGLTEEAVRVRLHRGRAAVAAAFDHRMADVYGFDGARCDRITEHVMRSVLALPHP
jgi:RNA polymerase sigma-70 factor (ECF subfamily)